MTKPSCFYINYAEISMQNLTFYHFLYRRKGNLKVYDMLF